MRGKLRRMRTDVVVAGAGMAGLACALDLRDAGLDVVVLEAGHRPGGRVRTVTFDDGRWVETGGEWIDNAHANVHELLARYGLQTVGDAPPWWEREAGMVHDQEGLHAAEAWLASDGVRADLARYDRLLDGFASGIVDPARPEDHPDAKAIDARSEANLFDEAELGERARFVLTRATEFEYTCEPGEVSALFLAQQRAVEIVEEAAVGEVRSQRVDGGLSRLATAIADDLGDAVRFGAPLVSLEHDADRVVARTPDDRIDATQLVLALPLPPLRRVKMDPVLPPLLGEAIAKVELGAVTKTFIRYPRKWSFAWVVSRGGMQRVYDATEEQPGDAGVLDAYIGGDAARALDAAFTVEAERVGHVASEIERIIPELGGSATGGASRSWTTHPRFGGSFSVWGPGQVTAFWRVLREPHGRIRLAGEHAATVCGYVEGAVESGRRVAGEILATR
jgi:monoamine oxidase